jgi:hypothetical protein
MSLQGSSGIVFTLTYSCYTGGLQFDGAFPIKGATASFPITKHPALKINYNSGAYINYGGDYQNISVAWHYSWIGWPH